MTYNYVHIILYHQVCLICTTTEIYFLSACKSYNHALPENTKNLTIDGWVYFYKYLFGKAVNLKKTFFGP